MHQKLIRNFAIIAHVDHGKSTLADRLLELTHAVSPRQMKEQYLDSLDLERERGITIKLKAVRMCYQSPATSKAYVFNLIDTPGHVDFSYEVSRSLAACEGAVLVVDATQGIQAQTLAHVQKALDLGLSIIPVVNKVDLPTAAASEVTEDLNATFWFKESEILYVSAKTGDGVPELLEAIVNRIPAPSGLAGAPLQALVFDSYYDEHQGVVVAVRVTGGQLALRTLLAMNSGASFDPVLIGLRTPTMQKVAQLLAGEVGFVATGLKDLSAVRVGDTITTKEHPAAAPLRGYKEVKPVVFVSAYPFDGGEFENLKKALNKLRLTDAALTFTSESSSALGFGFRLGFLGLLHSEIVSERLQRDFGILLIYSLPSVAYEVVTTKGGAHMVTSPLDFPDLSSIAEVREPWARLSILVPSRYLAVTLELCKKHRGVIGEIKYFSPSRVIALVDLPLRELIVNFFDELKSSSSGYASLDYELIDYRRADIVRLSILIHGEEVSALSQLIVREFAESEGRKILARLKINLPRQQFAVALQAAIGGKVLAREDIPAFRKDVLAKMSGGDQRRKEKLLDLQKRGKKKLRRLGKVSISAEEFRKILGTS